MSPDGVGRRLVWLLIALAAGAGCGSQPPYHVSGPLPLTAEQLNRLGRIELADPLSEARAEAAPRVWIGVPDRSAEGAVFGAVLGAAAGGVAGAAIGGAGGGGWLGIEIQVGAALGAIIGAPVGGVIGVAFGKPGPEARAAARQLRRHAASVDVSSLAREGASRSAKLRAYRDAGPAAGPGGTLTVEVVAYGTRAAGGNKSKPFVAIRTRLTDASTGEVIYDSTSDLRGERRNFHTWAQGGGADFRSELESLAGELGTRAVERALTPRAPVAK